MNDFSNLLPDTIFDAVSAQGFQPTGALFPLNSYENRVYEIGIEKDDPIIAKFYRPGRWSAGAIWDEHRFIQCLDENEIPVVSPLVLKNHFKDKTTLAEVENYHYCFYPKFRGRESSELSGEERKWLGRTLGRLHNVSATFTAKQRITLNPQTYGYESLDYILDQDLVPDDLKANLEHHLIHALELIDPFFNEHVHNYPIHGDCHLGNILWNRDGLHLVDFDDMVVGPFVQDVWMMFFGSPDEVIQQKEEILEGYEVFRTFDESSFILIEPLRTLRMIRHCAWIGKRFDEEIFQRTFPYYREPRYWQEFLLSIKEQIALLQEVGDDF